MFSVQINKLKGKQVFQYLLLASAILLPGFGFLYLAETKMFMSMEITKLIILSILYSVPIMLIWLLADHEEEDKNLFVTKISYDALMSLFIFCILYQIDIIMKNIPAIFIFYGTAVILGLVEYFLDRRKKKKI